MTFVIGVDPGSMIGIFAVAVSKLDHGSVSEVRFDYTAYQLSADSAHSVIELLLRTHEDVLVACERYVITTRTARLSQQPAALEFTGALKQLCRRYDTPFALQMKSDAGRMGNDAVLKRIAWYQPGMRHANDGARQALLALSILDPSALRTLLTSGSIVSTSH